MEFKRLVRMIGEKAEFKYQSVRNAFLAVDTDGDGKLSMTEVSTFFQHFGFPASVASDFFTMMDRDGSGDVDWREFMAIFAPLFKQKEPSCTPTSYRMWKLVPSLEGQRWHYSEAAPLPRRDCLVV